MYINWSDKNEVLEVVKSDGGALEYASDELQNNKEVVLAAVKENGWALAYASEELKSDKEVLLEAVLKNSIALEYVSEEIQNNNKDIILEAVKKNGWALEYASDALQNDKEVVLESIKNYSDATVWASDDIKKLIGNNDPVEVLSHEIAKEKSINMANNFRAGIEKLDKLKLDAIIAESKNSFKESEAKSNVVSIAEVKNEIAAEVQETPLANAPVRPHRRLKL